MKKILAYSVLIFLTTFLIWKGVVPAWYNVHSDFGNYYVSAKLVAKGESLERIYDNNWFQDKIKEEGLETPGKFSPFPPITAFMLLPLTSLTPLTAQRTFIFINLFFVAAGIVLLRKMTNWKILHCALLMLGGGLSIVNNVAFGQVYLIMAVLLMLSVILVNSNRPLLAGVIIGVLTSVKYFPIILLGGYFLNSFRIDEGRLKISATSPDMKVAASGAISLCIIVLFEYAFFGNGIMSDFIHSAFLPHLDGTLTGQGLYSFHYQSWDNLFRNLFIADVEFNPTPFIDWPFGKSISKLLVMAFIFTSVGVVIFRFKDSLLEKRRGIYLSILLISALVLLPASASYHFALILVPLSLIISSKLIVDKLLFIILLLYAMIGFIPYGLAFKAGNAFGLLFAYPRLWLLCSLYVVILYGLLKKELNISR